MQRSLFLVFMLLQKLLASLFDVFKSLLVLLILQLLFLLILFLSLCSFFLQSLYDANLRLCLLLIWRGLFLDASAHIVSVNWLDFHFDFLLPW